jgi:threonine 3-dehydrogenase
VHGRRIFHTWEETEALVADGKVDVNALISHRFPMSKFEDAFQVLFGGKGCKIVLYPINKTLWICIILIVLVEIC